MDDKNILFIVEGEVDEPTVIHRLFKVCNLGDYRIYSYRTNVHNLAKYLIEEYPTFEQEDIDIRLVLRSHEKDEDKKQLLSGKYTDIYMVFDFEPQQDVPRFKMIRRMLNFFQTSSEEGKLFINYPMMQSYRHINKMPDPCFESLKVTHSEYSKYKEIVSKYGFYNDINSYTYPIFMSLVGHHLKKLNYILNGTYAMPTLKEYQNIDYLKIFDKQKDFNENENWIYVLNTTLFILIDYNPTLYFNQIDTHMDMFDI